MYKIECYSLETEQLFIDEIRSNNGKCIVLGLAIVTDYVFNNAQLVTFVGSITDKLTDFDIEMFTRN